MRPFFEKPKEVEKGELGPIEFSQAIRGKKVGMVGHTTVIGTREEFQSDKPSAASEITFLEILGKGRNLRIVAEPFVDRDGKPSARLRFISE